MTASIYSPHVALVVEGPGDHGAMPVLVRRFLHSIEVYKDVLATPLAANGLGNLTKDQGLEKFLATASSRPGCRAIVVLLDADKACIKEAVEELRSRVAVKQPVVFCFADTKFEDWAYASAETLGLSSELEFEVARGGLGAIQSALGADSYTKPYHQPKLAAAMDLDLARSRNRSLDRALTRIEALVLETSFEPELGDQA